MQAEMPNATLITYPGVGHAAQEEAPEATVADVVSYLREVEATDEGAND